MSFLNLEDKRILVMGVANRKSVAWSITQALEAEGAEVIHSVRSEARLESLQKLLGDRKAYICDVEFPEQITALAGQVQADAEIAMVTAQWPKARVPVPPAGLQDRLWLPDANDVHVLAAAISGNADLILTENAKDFPRNILAEEGLSRSDPDAFLIGLAASAPEAVHHAVTQVHDEANRLSDRPWNLRQLLKKARLPRLGKALTAPGRDHSSE